MLKTLDNSLEVLKYFTKQNPAWGVRELAKEMDLSHSIVYRILSTFESHGFLIQNQETKKYELGFKFLEYASIIRDQFKITEMIYPKMKKIADLSGESVFLTWLDGTEGLCVEIAESSQKIKFDISIGTRSPLYIAASNKIIMAYLPEETQKAIIAKGLIPRTDRTVIEEDQLLADLEEIRKKGWAYSVGEYSEAVFGIAVPLFMNGKEIIASLTVSGPEYRMNESRRQEVLEILQNGRDEIQEFLDKLSFLNLTKK